MKLRTPFRRTVTCVLYDGTTADIYYYCYYDIYYIHCRCRMSRVRRVSGEGEGQEIKNNAISPLRDLGDSDNFFLDTRLTEGTLILL